MASYLKLEDNKGLQTRINEKASDLFKARKGKPQLQVVKCLKKKTDDGKEIMCIERHGDVGNMFELKGLRHESKNSSQFFTIRQERTYSSLDISRGLFEDLLDIYGVFSHFWKVVFTFGRKIEQNEFAFPDIKARRSFAFGCDANDIHESACILRRVELHGRELEEGQPPWSIRQTGVYHKLSTPVDSQNSISTFIFVAPSQNFEAQLSQSLDLSRADDGAIGPWNIYRLLVVDSLRGWLDYMTWLEEALKEQSRGIIYAKVDAEKENLSPLTDFTINFIDRQNLKILEDYVIDLQVILPTLLCNVIGIREQCEKWCNRHCKTSHECDCSQILEEFDEHIREVKCYIRRAEALKERATSTAQLLSDLLSYEDAIQLKEVANQSHNESKSMLFLAVRSTKDAAAVKILTIISLIYLPSTIIAKNFFSTQFVHTDENGNLAVSGNTWILAACVVPLTAITIALWWIWVYCTNIEKPEAPQLKNIQKTPRYNCFRSFLSPKSRKRAADLETGEARSVGTWSSAATAVTGKSLEN